MARRRSNRKSQRIDSHVDNNGSEVLLVRADQLIVDKAYQRWTTKGRIDRIARTFDWKAFGIPTVAPRKDGNYALLDGQNRFLAMLQRFGGTTRRDGSPRVIRVEARLCKTIADEARIFAMINLNNKSLTKPDFFHAGACSGDPAVRAIIKKLADYGFRVAYGPGQTQPNETRCAGVFMDAYTRLGPRKFGLMIRVLARCYQRDDGSGYVEREALTAAFLHGLVHYLDETTGSFASIERKLQRAQSAADVLSAAKQDRDSLIFTGWRRQEIVAKHIGEKARRRARV
jgi:hypothetical protein